MRGKMRLRAECVADARESISDMLQTNRAYASPPHNPPVSFSASIVSQAVLTVFMALLGVSTRDAGRAMRLFSSEALRSAGPGNAPLLARNRLLLVPALLLAFLSVTSTQALAESNACQAINADWTNVHLPWIEETDWGVQDKSYPASDFLPTDQVSFSISDGAPGADSYFFAYDSDVVNGYLEYFAGVFSIGGTSTTVSGTDLVSGGLRMVYANGQNADLTVSVHCVSAPVAPTITTAPVAAIVNAGGTVTFSVVASDATSYQWQVNTGGGGYANIINGAPYSGATTATLTITGATAGMDGYQYRVIASGGALPDATSAGVSLTINSPPVATSFAVAIVPYGSSAANIALNTHVTNSPTSYALGSATTAQGGSVSVDPGTGAVTYTAPTGFRGTDSFTFTASNSAGPSSPATVTVPVGNPTITVTPTTLTAGTGSAAYSQTLTASAGRAPYTFSTTLASGALPAGISLGSNGTISGTPTASGTFTFTVTGTDSSLGTGPFTFTSSTISLNIAAPTISIGPTTLPAPAFGTAYAQTLTASGGNGSYTFGISAGSLPAGIILSASGALSGTPTAAGGFSFTAEATDGNGFTGSQTYSGTVNAVVPGIPTIGSATAADGEATVSFSAPASNGGAVITNYTVTSSPGGLTATGSASPITVSGLTNGTAYTFTVTASNSTGAGTASAASNSVTPAPSLAAPIANAVSATVAANSSANPVTLNITGGTATTVAIAVVPSHGTATASGAAITYIPTAGYSGADSFTYTATNATGTSSPATVIITVTAPTFTFAPAAGALIAGTAGTAYSETIAASGGGAPYTFAVTTGSLPSGLSLATDGTISGTPTADENASFTITATDTHGATGTASYSLVIGAQAPFANGVSATVAANSSANPITLDITGGAPASVAVASAAGHGTATASGTAITYTPVAGYSGADSFTYTATNATGTSSPATVTITVTAPTFTFAPAAGALATGTAGTAYSETIAASGGGVPYTYAVTTGSLPSGLSLATDGTISGTPTADGNFSFTITATDTNGATGTASYSLQVDVAGSATFVFTPAAGALSEAMAGEDYSQAISAAGGTAPLIYSVSSGTLPQGMVLNISTGELSGPLDASTEGDYGFSIQVRDNNGATGTAAYTLKVKAQDITVTDKVVNVPAGSSPSDVYLNRGATGGPFTSAAITFVEPANAGSSAIIQGQLAQSGPVMPVGWYLQFTPNPAYSGQVRVGFRLTSALGVSNTGTVTYNLNVAAGQVAEDIDHLVRDFVRSRQNMISSTVKVPGLLERRQMQQESNPVTARLMPSANGLTVGFSTSLAQMEAAGRTPVGGKSADLSPFNIWIDGAFLAHRDGDTDDGKWGSFAMINLGADYLLSDKALLGFSLHYDRMTDPTDADAELSGNGWLAGPYASFEIGKDVFWNASLLYGGSSNDIDTYFWDGTFDTTRWMADTSIEGQWAIDGDTILTPKLRAVYFSERVEDYAVSNGSGDTIVIDGFDAEQFRLSLGAEIARSFTVESGSVLTPKLGLTTGFSGLDGSGAFGSLTAGLSIQTVDQWMIDVSLLLNVEGDGEASAGTRVGAAKRF